MRARLWALQHRVPVPSLPPAGLVAIAPPDPWPEGFAAAMGWIEAGPMLLRLDVAERIAADLAWRTRRGPSALPLDLASRLSIRADLLPVALRRLGFRVQPASSPAAEAFGPPAPAMLVPLRRRTMRPPAPPPEPSRTAPSRVSPFSSPELPDQEDRDWQRLDKWLWCARFLKARSDCTRLASRGPDPHQPPTHR